MDLGGSTSPDGDQGHSTGDIYIVVASIMTALILVCVTLRFYITFRIQRSPGWDDAACLVATLCQLSYTGLLIYVCTIGLGKNIWEIEPSTMSKILNLVQTNAILAEPCLFFTKLSLFLLYWRLFSPKVAFRWAIYIGVAICAVFYLAAMLLFIFTKNDFVAAAAVNKSVGIFNPITDAYLFSLPLVCVFGLKMPLKRKLGVAVVFLLGLLACVMSILSAVYRFAFSKPGDTNITRSLIPVFTVNTVEVSVGIMCSCMPLFPALFGLTRVRAWLRGLSSQRSSRSRLNSPYGTKSMSIQTRKVRSLDSPRASNSSTSSAPKEEEV